jgi:hypothetical protein
MVFEYVVASQHVHILTTEYYPSPTTRYEVVVPPMLKMSLSNYIQQASKVLRDNQLPVPAHFPLSRDVLMQKEITKFYNVSYSHHEFGNSYSISKWGFWEQKNRGAYIHQHVVRGVTERLYASKRVTESSGTRFIVPGLVCRQFYAETKILPYMYCSFSFQDEGTFKDWVHNRSAMHKRVLGSRGGSIWMDAEWYMRSNLIEFKYNLFGKECGIKKITISRLALRSAERRLRAVNNNGWLDRQVVDFTKTIEQRMGKAAGTISFEIVD